ncbi:MAG: nucleoside kinase [Synergistaceae bacterium]|nr:nucleoside kinase [Synergistaceae bacterium]
MRSLNSASYCSSLSFLLVIACRKLLGRDITLKHSISEAYYWEFQDGGGISDEDVNRLSDYIKDLVSKDIPFEKRMMSMNDARSVFEKQEQKEFADLLGLAWVDPVDVYSFGDLYGFFYTPLVESSKHLNLFKIFRFASGMCVQCPEYEGMELPSFYSTYATEKLSSAFLGYANWLKILGVSYMNSLHRTINSGEGKHLVLVSEAFHAQEITEIAESISRNGARIITIAGPSSSGKTTFSERLKIQLYVCGKRPVTLPMDNYFLDRSQFIAGSDGKPNFEVPEALDLDLLKDHLSKMIKGEEVQTPKYDFISGKKYAGKIIKLDKDDVLIMEGIHGLNDKILGQIPSEYLFTLFAAPMTGVCLDPYNRTSTGDNRLLRRIIRDNRTRGYSAENTLSVWPKVVAGAAKYIFPYQGRADKVFNSSLPYELAVIKNYIMPLFHSVPEDSPVFCEVLRLQGMLKFIPSMSADNIPNNSVLREFIGGTCFDEVEK